MSDKEVLNMLKHANEIFLYTRMLEISIPSDSSILSHSSKVKMPHIKKKMPQFENNMRYNAHKEVYTEKCTGKCTPKSVPGSVHREMYTGSVHQRYTYECVHRDVYTVPYTPLYIVTLVLFDLSRLN